MPSLLRAAVEQKRVPLAVAMVADARGVVYQNAVGAEPDAIFRIASMTKPVTSVAAGDDSRSGETPRGVNTMAWLGIFNTFFWIDREKQVCAVLMTQMLPGLDPGARKVFVDFDRAVYAWVGR